MFSGEIHFADGGNGSVPATHLDEVVGRLKKLISRPRTKKPIAQSKE
ncbi:hypothetical protein FTUN_0998 [Frigoriglobus tundricola]|uniref:Uncharacterized protein n=1 Tax=Frigoriglobus tundricola TaxID=2774151 RepID=A0A6M5YKH5_9BACT|nr:hypothetical protein FTUN_0998 [Frigoriglobus tundricola]